ncbi:MAG: hypothetical protein HYX27_06590 [Acidobacteria bacterium]|nr:hypothetical protein [Acidobacteriota bacterium]
MTAHPILTTEQWQQAETLFHTALDLPREEREAWVAESCPSDPSLAMAVIRMLEADDNPGDEIRRAVRSAVKEWLGR